MISRESDANAVLDLLRRNPVVGILGARQVGKTTLAHLVAKSIPGPTAFFDLEDPQQVARLSDPMLTLRNLRGLIVLDEIQHVPELFRALRVLADRRPRRARFLVLGSASPTLLRQSSESLAGRIAYCTLHGFSLEDVGVRSAARLWQRGGFPRSYLARSDTESHNWRRDFVRTFLERDLPQLGIGIAATTMRRFWTMLAHYNAQTWNASEFARSFGVADTTVRSYLDVLTATLVLRQLPPWHENIGKRQVKSPKVFIADTGLLHTLLGIRTTADLDVHPKLGASWEGFVIGEIIRHLRAEPEECYFWATHQNAELDLLIVRGRKRFGFEIKRTSAPQITPSMRIAKADLKLHSIDLIHAGDDTFDLGPGFRAVALKRVAADLEPLK